MYIASIYTSMATNSLKHLRRQRPSIEVAQHLRLQQQQRQPSPREQALEIYQRVSEIKQRIAALHEATERLCGR